METTSKMVIIDTDQYAGNFEREMCAFITGHIGDCEVGESEASKAQEEIVNQEWFMNNISSKPDDNGCWRPCKLYMSPNNQHNNSVAIFVDELPTNTVLAEFINRARAYCTEHNITFNGMRFAEPTYSVKFTEVNIV